MAITCDQVWNSPEKQTGSTYTAQLVYVIRGTIDEDEAWQALADGSPTTVATGAKTLKRNSLKVQPLGLDSWRGTSTYGLVAFTPNEVGDSVYGFTIGGGTEHVAQSRSTVAAYAPTGQSPPDFDGAINFDGENVNGVDIRAGGGGFTETHYMSNTQVTDAYKRIVARLYAHMNASPFKGHDRGEVLFDGAQGTRRGDDDWEVTFKFIVSKTRRNYDVGSIRVAEKLGWDYLWVYYLRSVSENVIVKQPRAIYVERVYEFGDFASLGIGT